MASIERLGQAKIVFKSDGGGSPRSSRSLTSDLEANINKQPVSPMKPLIVGEDGLVPADLRGTGEGVTCYRLVDGEERVVHINNKTGEFTIFDPNS